MTEFDNHQLNWSEGNYGRGLLDQRGFVHTWNNDDHDLHADYMLEHDIPWTQDRFYISPDGTIEGFYQDDEALLDTILEADPALKRPQPDWQF